MIEARARFTDPLSSHLAARQVQIEGTAEAHRTHVLKLIRRMPGATGYELAALDAKDSKHPLTHAQILRRTHELANNEIGLIRRGSELRKCTICNRLCTTWYPEDNKPSAPSNIPSAQTIPLKAA